jgi:para-aminobenzoate synthetase component 1
MEPVFWMGGIAAMRLVEIRHDLAALKEPGFWVIVGTFEGQWTLARCEEIRRGHNWQSFGSESLVDEWVSSLSRDEYIEYVARLREHIAAGDVYQVNACRILSSNLREDHGLRGLMSRIVSANPAPFASYLNLPEIEIASASPERFISLTDGSIKSSPIKGTSATNEFLEKDHSENLMIVDLIRNDIGRIAVTGSVTTPRLLAAEEHPGLFHLVSDVSAKVRPEVDIVEILRALMPPGSVSGAPKSSALKIIKANEVARGPYCGAIGWYESGRAEIAVGIRTFWRSEGRIHFGTGAGITWGSQPEAEWEETELKARRLISLVAR